jgi:hypothetical protein
VIYLSENAHHEKLDCRELSNRITVFYFVPFKTNFPVLEGSWEIRWAGHMACIKEPDKHVYFIKHILSHVKHTRIWIMLNFTTGVWINVMSWGSSVSTVSDYRLDDQGPIPGKGIFLQPLCPDQL